MLFRSHRVVHDRRTLWRYAFGRYKPNEQPQMTDEAFVAADDFVIRLEDFRTRFGPGADEAGR